MSEPDSNERTPAQDPGAPSTDNSAGQQNQARPYGVPSMVPAGLLTDNGFVLAFVERGNANSPALAQLVYQDLSQCVRDLESVLATARAAEIQVSYQNGLLEGRAQQQRESATKEQ